MELAQLVEQSRHIGKVSGSIIEIGELAQLVERLHGMQEVSGSNPLFST